MPDDSFHDILVKFEQMATVSGDFFFCNLTAQVEIAKLLEEVSMSLRDRFIFVMSPTKLKDSIITDYLVDFAISHSRGKKCGLDSITLSEPDRLDSGTLVNLERDHRIVILYLWLSIRFPETFHDLDRARSMKIDLEDRINENLLLIGSRKGPKKAASIASVQEDIRAY